MVGRAPKTGGQGSWLRAALSGPGPETPWQALVLAGKGFCMGAADIVPGVSGGTIAFITGIYENLLLAIKSVNARFMASLFRLDIRSALAEVHLRFLLPLLLGLGVAIMGVSRFMHHLLVAYPVETWALFMGLIAASIWVVARKVEHWNAAALAAVLLGAVGGYLVVGLIPVTTPNALWFIFLCGMIAICAMILPGVSGAFLLLLLGKYEYITGTLKNPFDPANALVIAVFASGCVVGLAGFARFLTFLLKRRHAETVALLTGLMIGGLRKVWPWKEVLETRIIRGKEYVLREQNVLPDAAWSDLAAPLSLIVAGVAVVLLLEYLSLRSDR